MNALAHRWQRTHLYDFFAIALRDGSFGLGEFVSESVSGEKLCALYRLRAPSPESLRARLGDVDLADAVGLVSVCTRELERGEWRILGNHAPSKRAYLATLRRANGATYTGDIAAEFLEAYHSLRSWNDFPMAPVWFRSILLPYLEPPAQIRVPAPTNGSTVEPTLAEGDRPSAADCPADVHVTVAVDGRPDIVPIRSRRQNVSV
jgi:hypothetical protein